MFVPSLRSAMRTETKHGLTAQAAKLGRTRIQIHCVLHTNRYSHFELSGGASVRASSELKLTS